MDTSEIYIKMCDNQIVQDAMKIVKDKYLIYYPYAKYGDHHSNISLPRQDQLQEMMFEESDKEVMPDAITKLLGYFNDYSLTVCPQFASMEQLWLAFVMKEKYNKIWNGEDWIENT